MPDFSVTFARSAERELLRLDPPIARRVMAAINRLVVHPRPSGCVKLTGSQNEWRIRVGDWRIIYTIDDAKKVIDISGIRHRSDAYR